MVAAVLVEGRRISGDKLIIPDDETRTAIQRNGVAKTSAAFKLCIDTVGLPASVELMSSSCFPRYDERLRSRIKTWRYSPYSVDGVPKAVCTRIIYIYSNGPRRR